MNVIGEHYLPARLIDPARTYSAVAPRPIGWLNAYWQLPDQAPSGMTISPGVLAWYWPTRAYIGLLRLCGGSMLALRLSR